MAGGPGTGADILAAAADLRDHYGATAIANFARGAGFRDDRASNDGQPIATGKVDRRDGNGKGRRSELHVAIAIALAESGGLRKAENPSGAVGLWQICCTGDDALKDPETNARAAWNKYVGAGYSFKPWTTFNNGQYLLNLPQAFIGVRNTHRDRPAFTGGGTGTVHDVIAFGADVGQNLGTFFAWITSGETWIRLGEMIAGGLLVAFALYLLFVHTRGQAAKGATA